MVLVDVVFGYHFELGWRRVELDAVEKGGT